MTRQQKGWAKIAAGIIGAILSAWLFLSGVEDATSTTSFGECGFGELADDEGNCP